MFHRLKFNYDQFVKPLNFNLLIYKNKRKNPKYPPEDKNRHISAKNLIT